MRSLTPEEEIARICHRGELDPYICGHKEREHAVLPTPIPTHFSENEARRILDGVVIHSPRPGDQDETI